MASEITKADRLRGLTAMLESTTAKANHDLQKYGEWMCNWAELMGQYEQQIEDLLAAAEHDREGERDGLRVLHDSPTWQFVLAFAVRMEAKLAKNRHKGDRPGWLPDQCPPEFLRDKLDEERNELDDAIRLGESVNAVWDEAADEANLCMMRADNYEAALSARQPGEGQGEKPKPEIKCDARSHADYLSQGGSDF